MIRIAINGFGRIGRTFLRVLLNDETIHKHLELIALNLGPASTNDLVYAIKYDSIMGTYTGPVSFENGILKVNNFTVRVLTQKDATQLPWQELNIDWVVDASGHFTKRADAQKHLDAGAKKILITAPAKDEDIAIIPGVNDARYKKEHRIVSLGSCTTNALAPIIDVINKTFNIQHAAMTTVHAYTNSQALLDVENPKTRLSRAAAINMIPTSTGASEMVGKIFPELAGKIIGHSIRVPLATVSLVDVVMQVNKPTDAAAVNRAFEHASTQALKGIMAVTHEPLVSSDFSGNPHSVIIDGQLTSTNGQLIKVFGWYDNEWGYSTRLKDFLRTTA